MNRHSKITAVIILLAIVCAVFGIMYMIQSAKEAEDLGEEDMLDAGPGQTKIQLEKDNVVVTGVGASVSGTTVTITQAGTYMVSGVLENGQIYVDAEDEDIVELSFRGAEISNSDEAAIHIENAGLTRLILERGTFNCALSGIQQEWDTLEEGIDEDASGGAIYARSDLAIEGIGSLQVYGYINNGIHTTDNLTIDGGNVEVTALNIGLKGKDSVNITAGNFTIQSGGDGVHSDGSIAVSGGILNIVTGDDGIHADEELTITDGDINITESHEGLEANQIYLSGGDINITADDDGINAFGGKKNRDKDESEKTKEKLPNIYITGASVTIDAEGDGIDSNGNLYVEGGYVVVNGPTKFDDGALDFGSENGGVCVVSGGTVFAIGSSGMAETFNDDSKQCAFRYYFDSTLTAGSEITIADGQDRILFQHTVTKPAGCVVFSCPGLEIGETYHLTVDGQTADIVQDAVSVTAGQIPRKRW